MSTAVETVDEDGAAERPNVADLVRGRAALVVVPAVTVSNANRQVLGFVRPPAGPLIANWNKPDPVP